MALIKLTKSLENKGLFANNSFQLVMTYYFVLPLPKSIIRAKSRAKIIRILVYDLGNELLQCEFTNELRNYREDIRIICNHIAVKNQTYLFGSRSLI